MDKKRQEFLKRLRETFRIEAAEHLQNIASGLIELERVVEADRPALVERIFREAHSLKGAARSVSLEAVERVCQKVESIFAGLKCGDLVVSPLLIDDLQTSLALIGALCAASEAKVPDNRAEEDRIVAILETYLSGNRKGHPPIGVPTAPDSSPPSSIPSSEPGAGKGQNIPLASAADSPPPNGPLESSPTGSSSSFSQGAPGSDTVRVAIRKLDELLVTAEELIGSKLAAADRAFALHRLANDVDQWIRHRNIPGPPTPGSRRSRSEEDLFTQTLSHTLRTLARSAVQDARTLEVLSNALLDTTRKLLLLPCSTLFDTLPLIVRDLARNQNKDAALTVQGEDIEIDRRVLEELKDPLIHLLRNAVDHGLEKPDRRMAAGKPSTGKIILHVKPEPGNKVAITVSDDGAGIDIDKVKAAGVRLGLVSQETSSSISSQETMGLIFQSGLSTSPILTNISGRGLGLAIVREKVEKLGGSISAVSEPSRGTSFRLLVPVSLATFRGVVVETAGNTMIIPTANVVRVARVRKEEIRSVENRQTITLAGKPTSLVRLRDVLELGQPDRKADSGPRPVVLVRAGSREIAFLVDDVQGEHEVRVKHLGRQLIRIRHVAGATVSGSGTVIPILDPLDLVESASRAGAPIPVEAAEDAVPARPRLLLAEDSITSRTLVKNILAGAGYDVVVAVDGLDAMNRLKTESVDLVVSDVDMPRLNGFELTSRIRADRKLENLPVVLVTALASPQDRERGIEVGANAYIVKSDFDQANLLEIIRRLL